MCNRMANCAKQSNGPGKCGRQCSNRPLLLTKVGLQCHSQHASIIPLSHIHRCTLHWWLSLTLVFHIISAQSLVPVLPTEMALWQSWEWIIALLASRTYHTPQKCFTTHVAVVECTHPCRHRAHALFAVCRRT